MGLINNSFILNVAEEARPPKKMMGIAGMKDELRRPLMLVVKKQAVIK